NPGAFFEEQLDKTEVACIRRERDGRSKVWIGPLAEQILGDIVKSFCYCCLKWGVTAGDRWRVQKVRAIGSEGFHAGELLGFLAGHGGRGRRCADRHCRGAVL